MPETYIAAAGKEREMERKTFRAPIELKADEEGTFRAAFATLNVIDHDKDVTLPGAFEDGGAVRIAHWNHGWHALPVGKGAISEADEQAIVDGRFFLNTEAGRDHYQTVKELGDLQEWSYAFDIVESENGEYEGEKVRFLKKLKVHEVCPVMLGAGIGTHTMAIKGLREALQSEGSRGTALQEIHDMLVDLGAKCAGGHSGDGGEGMAKGEAGDGKPKEPGTSTLAAQVALELIEWGVEE